MTNSILRLVRDCTVSVVLGLAFVFSSQALEIGITVTPRVLNISSSGKVVTVHTDLPYGYVEVSSVFLNGVPIQHWKADNQGNFVAKFLMQEVETLPGLVIGRRNTLLLLGATIDGEAFSGTDEVMVIEIQGKVGR